MTRDNDGRVNTDNGEPGPGIEPADVIQCRECGGMVRRLNNQHLETDRCRYTKPEEVRVGEDDREDLLRQDHPDTVAEYKDKYPDAPVISPRERMKLAETNRDPDVDARRRELLKRRWRGESMTNIVESLANRHDVSENAIWTDWTDRDKWIGRVFGLEDAETVVVESLAQKQDVRERLMKVASRAEDQNEINAAVRALKAVDDNIDDTIEHQQKLGNVDQAASQHEVHVEGEVDHKHEPVGDGLDEDTLRQLDEMTGGEDEEVIDAEYEVVDEEEADG